MDKYDLIVIGGGVGGLVITSGASQLGLKVALIEKAARLGGDCLHFGCVPSKTLIHSAKVASLMRRAEEFGLQPSDVTVDLGKVNRHVHAVIDKIQEADDPERFRSYGATVLFGAPRFASSTAIDVNGA